MCKACNEEVDIISTLADRAMLTFNTILTREPLEEKTPEELADLMKWCLDANNLMWAEAEKQL